MKIFTLLALTASLGVANGVCVDTDDATMLAVAASTCSTLSATPGVCDTQLCSTCPFPSACDASCGFCTATPSPTPAPCADTDDASMIGATGSTCAQLQGLNQCSSQLCPTCAFAGYCDDSCGFCPPVVGATASPSVSPATCPDLDANGLVDIMDLEVGQMRVLRPNGEGIGCALGGDYSFLVRRGSAGLDKVMVEFMGGGACWSYGTCAEPDSIGEFVDTSFLDSLNADCQPWGPLFGAVFDGLLDPDTPSNPVPEYTVVFVSYCTKDVHSGDVAQTYVDPTDSANTISMNHYGGNNAKAVLEYVKEQFPSPERMLVTGCSAGAVGAGIHGAALADHYAETSPTTTVNVLADAFAMLATDDFARSYITNWGSGACLMDGLFNEGDGQPWEGTEDYGLHFWTGVRTHTAKANGFTALVSSEDDDVQEKFYEWMGGNADEMALRILDRASVVDSSFIFSGAEHCGTSMSTRFVAEVPEYAEFVGWISGLFDASAAGTSLPDAYACPTCTKALATGCDGVVGSETYTDNCGTCGDPSASTCEVEEPAWTTDQCSMPFECYIDECGCPGAFLKTWCNEDTAKITAPWCSESAENCETCTGAICYESDPEPPTVTPPTPTPVPHDCYINQCGCPDAFAHSWCSEWSAKITSPWCMESEANCNTCSGAYCAADLVVGSYDYTPPTSECFISQCGCPGAFAQEWCTEASAKITSPWCGENTDNCATCSGTYCEA